ncbi:MAG TPA: prepilin-type N-terminal cleavage/methylation domain-containing protein [Candidatus Omnitrophota bacterium]|nr:prepilin-type N-terminal cleavage/methylation domain-containing protein [Candidatus Omnitrophota bacterium]
MGKTDRRGFTLVEILIALAITVPVLFGIIVSILHMYRANEVSHEVITALQDAHAVIEQIRNVSRSGLSAVTAQFPNGGAVAGFNNLTNEQVVVTYPNATADPLAVTVTTTWTNRNRAVSRALRTRVTQR